MFAEGTRGAYTLIMGVIYLMIEREEAMRTETINQRCACSNLRQVTRVLTLHFDKALSQENLRSTQFTLLVALSNHDCYTLTAMANSMAMDRTTLTRNLSPLERAGFIECVSTTDKRSKSYRLTALGQETVQRCIPLWENTQKELENIFGLENYGRYLNDTQHLLKLVLNLPQRDGTTPEC
jgi:DNA-binding MarR family transcriptional regulator